MPNRETNLILEELRRIFDEHEDRDEQRFQDLREGSIRIEDRVKRIEEVTDSIDAEVGGAPRLTLRDPKRLSLRDRVHEVENDRDGIAMLAKGLGERLAAVDAIVGELKDERDSFRSTTKVLRAQWVWIGRIVAAGTTFVALVAGVKALGI